MTKMFDDSLFLISHADIRQTGFGTEICCRALHSPGLPDTKTGYRPEKVFDALTQHSTAAQGARVSRNLPSRSTVFWRHSQRYGPASKPVAMRTIRSWRNKMATTPNNSASANPVRGSLPGLLLKSVGVRVAGFAPPSVRARPKRVDLPLVHPVTPALPAQVATLPVRDVTSAQVADLATENNLTSETENEGRVS